MRFSGLLWLNWSLLLIVSGGLVGCSDPTVGTAKISSESRERLLPHAAPKAGDSKQGAPARKALSIKDRGRVAAPSSTPAPPEDPAKDK